MRNTALAKVLAAGFHGRVDFGLRGVVLPFQSFAQNPDAGPMRPRFACGSMGFRYERSKAFFSRPIPATSKHFAN